MRALTILGALALAHWGAGQSSAAEDESVPGPARAAIDEAAARGLAWLAKTQTAAGCWTGDVGHKREDDYLVVTTAAEQAASGSGHLGVTSLAALAFLANGHLPGRGAHSGVVERAHDYVLAHVQDNGYVTDSGTRMYSHAFATLLLAEVHGMATGPAVKDALERAVHWIVDTQNHQGGWRYNPFTLEADLSVTVCQLQALRAARNIGIRVPKVTIDRAVDYVLRSRTPRGRDEGLFYYKIAGRGAYDKNHEFAINAAAITSLHSAGLYDRELVEPALRFLELAYPWVAADYTHHFYFWYGNYYACQALFQAGPSRFAAYHARLCHDLLRTQQRDGRWINDVGPGDPFATAVACLLLAIPSQYLPIFQR